MPELPPAIYEEVFYSIENPALVIDLDFTVYDANQAAADFLNYESREQLIGTRVDEIVVDSDILRDVAERITQNERWVGECELRTYDNRVFFGVGSAVPIELDGEPQVIAGVFTDLTERRRYTQSLKILNRVLRHNIRNDINVVLGSVEQLVAHIDDESALQHAERVRDRLDDIVKSADTARELEFLISEQGKSTVSTTGVEWILDDALTQAKRRHPEATFEAPDTFESATVIANETLHRVFSELLDNAVRHNDAADPHVEVTLDVREGDVLVTVADDGPGIPPGRRDMVFGREEVDQLHHGDGFSLFFVDQVVTIYGGDVWVEDSELGGAAFKLRLPRPR